MSIKEIAEKLLFQFSARSIKSRPFIIAIDGLSGAGKTTFVKKLEHEINNHKYKVVIFHMDDHIVEKNKRYGTGHEEWYEYYYLQWNVEMLTTHLFEVLHNNRNVTALPFYEASTDTSTIKSITIASDSIVLIEIAIRILEIFKPD